MRLACVASNIHLGSLLASLYEEHDEQQTYGGSDANGWREMLLHHGQGSVLLNS